MSREEFTTLMVEAAAIVNNTPLAEVSCDPNNPFPVCPAALLNLRENPNPPSSICYTAEDLLSYGARRWRRVQFLADSFWRRWRRDYLHALSVRRKWLRVKPNLAVGDVVLIVEPTPRNLWPMGIVTKVNVNPDQLVRSVGIRLKPGRGGAPRSTERAIHDLVLLLRPPTSSATG